MRKLRGAGSAPAGNGSAGNSSGSGSTGPSTANGGSTLTTAASEDGMLDARVQMSLHTLKKLFNEYTHPKEPLSEQERDMKLYQMLPLFCKVGTRTPSPFPVTILTEMNDHTIVFVFSSMTGF